MKYEAAIFDMDGTLLDSMRYWRYTPLEYMLKHQLPIHPEDLVRMETTSSRRLLVEMASRDGRPIDDVQAMVTELESYMDRHYMDDIKVLPNVEPLLQKLKAAGLKLCVATSTPKLSARNALTHFGLIDYFDFVADCYEYGIGKSDEQYFHIIAERLGTTTDKCIVFEDALYAMKTAKKVGCAVVAMEDSTARLQKDEIKALADRYVTDYAQLF
ncbi:MAG: HAD family phosphatase [Clostridia bacterium]|nr:HAD family phosphatase [Clostridia bacterium]